MFNGQVATIIAYRGYYDIDVSITMKQTHLDDLRLYYDKLIPEFILMKDAISVEYILNFIGEKE